MKQKTIKKFLSTKELVELGKKDQGVGALLSVFPNVMGLNLCAVKGIEFTVTDDKYGQLVSMNVEFIPSEDTELLEQAHNEYGAKPWYDLWK